MNFENDKQSSFLDEKCKIVALKIRSEYHSLILHYISDSQKTGSFKPNTETFIDDKTFQC